MMKTMDLHINSGIPAFEEEGNARGISGLISPRFLPSYTPRFQRKHFRDSEGPSDDEEVSSSLEQNSDELVVVDIERAQSSVREEHDEKFQKLSGAERRHSVSSLKTHRRRKNSVDGPSALSCDSSRSRENSVDEGSTKSERERRATASDRSECGRLRTLSQDSVISPSTASASSASSEEHSDTSQHPGLRDLRSPRLPYCGDDKGDGGDEEPTTSRRARQKVLLRSSRMSPQEIRSIMSTVDSPRHASSQERPESVSPRPLVQMVKSTTTPRFAKPANPFIAPKVLGSSNNLAPLASPSNASEDDAVSPLCCPSTEAPPTTPKAISETMQSADKNGKHSFRNGEKPRSGHTRFFSMSTLKTNKTQQQQQKKGGTGPSSPLFGKKPFPSSSPDGQVFSMTLEDVVKEPEICMMFLEYLERQNASEGLEFLIKLEALRNREISPGVNLADLHKEASSMYEEFIREGSDKELNLSRSVRDEIEAKLCAPGASSIEKPSTLFQEANVEVFQMLGTNMYSQWLATLH